jgi:hypothetical protein
MKGQPFSPHAHQAFRFGIYTLAMTFGNCFLNLNLAGRGPRVVAIKMLLPEVETRGLINTLSLMKMYLPFLSAFTPSSLG